MADSEQPRKSSIGSWAGDRRFMGMTGKEVHGGSRRLSGDSATEAGAAKASSPPQSAAADAESGKTYSFSPFAGDRRFMGMSGKEVHEPARRPSASSGTASKDSAPKASSPPQGSLTGMAAALAGRRRSSAASQGGGIGSGLMSTRSGDHIDARRQEREDMKAPGGFGGFFSSFTGGSK